MKLLVQTPLELGLRLSIAVRSRTDHLLAEPEAGIDSSTEKAIYIVGGVVLGLGIIAAMTAWINGYLGKLP